ncbi:hypothetical protein [Psychromonas sp.]|uniref:hypothetical protein n=1 Tax=Psychromonas sp. TaxID=1884585 RepID=UPI0039E25B01
MKKIVIHLGLPKTASTTLQHHLFQKLYEQGKINFLGKVLSVDDKTGQIHTTNNSGKVIRDICEGKLERSAINTLDKILSDTLLNVYSDEGLMACYPGLDNRSLEEKLTTLKSILAPYEVKILISLRNPVDYFYSLYVQFYGQYYLGNKDYDTFDSYIRTYEKDRHNKLYESFHYADLLSKLGLLFETQVILFEDLKHDKNHYYETVAKTLSLPTAEISKLLESKHENKKQHIENSIIAVSNKSLALRLSKFEKRLRTNKVIFKIIQFMYHSKLIPVKYLLNKKITTTTKLDKLTNEQKTKLADFLLLSATFDAEYYGLEREKLIRYSYITP